MSRKTKNGQRNGGAMAKKDPGQEQFVEPQYTIGEIMDLLKMDQASVRELIVGAGVDLDLSKKDRGEKIAYEDYRKLWVSRANRPEGKLLAALLVEESENWFDKLFRS
jgi:hypothetical protein